MEWFRVPEKIYFKRGCLPIALNELKEVYNRKRAVVLVNDNGFRKGIIKPVTDKLDQLGICYSAINVYDGEVEAVMQSAFIPKEERRDCIQKWIQKLLKEVKQFEPDCIIAVGHEGISVGKELRILYENPELTVNDLAVRNNLRDRSLSPLKTGNLYLVAVAEAHCSGNEISPFMLDLSVGDIVGNYDCFPDMSIIDMDMLSENRTDVIASMCMRTILGAVNAMNFECTSDYAHGLAVHAVRLILEYFPKYQENTADQYALERLINATEMAHIAFFNVCVAKVLNSKDYRNIADALDMNIHDLENRFEEIAKIAHSVLM